MQCRRCGKELDGSLRCNFCGYENTAGNVRELTRTEKVFYDGETIDVGGTDSSGSSGQQSRDENFRRQSYGSRRTFVHVGGGGGIFSRAVSWLLREVLSGNRLVQVALTLVFVAFAALMFFVTLPIVFVLLAAGIVIFALKSN